MNNDELVQKALPQTLRLVKLLHGAALRYGCTMRIDERNHY